MAKVDVLARVKEDLAVGHTYTAIQRLRTLVAVDPQDLDVHAMLAEVYRQTGNLVEAGRWSFLSAEAKAEELAAFERAHPDPWLRLRQLRWQPPPELVTDDTVRERLAALTAAAHENGPPARFSGLAPPARTHRVACLFVALTLGVVGVLATIGVVRVILGVLGV